MEDYLKKLQKTEIDILKEIDRVCEKLNINYVIISGTLLGAIRHQGFIPWDDDIDIGMIRHDFNIFLREGQKYLPSNLFIQHYTTEKNDNKIYIKARNINTEFIEKDTENEEICHGIFVDIFPFDKSKKGKWNEKIEFYKRKKFNMLVQCYSRNTIQTIIHPIKRKLAEFINKSYCKLIPIRKVLEKEEKRRIRLDGRGDDCYLLNQFSWNGTVTEKELFDKKKYKFDGEYFWGPVNYDSILRKYYGEYMIIPSPDKQITHKPLLIKFED